MKTIKAKVPCRVRDIIANEAGTRGVYKQVVIRELLEAGIKESGLKEFIDQIDDAYALGGSLGWSKIGKLLEERHVRDEKI